MAEAGLWRYRSHALLNPASALLALDLHTTIIYDLGACLADTQVDAPFANS